MNPISGVINNQKDPIANRVKVLKPIANSLLVDQQLLEYGSLIDPSYIKWFAKKFYTLPAHIVQKAASEAKTDGKNPQRLFAHLIKKYQQQTVHNLIKVPVDNTLR